MPNRKIELTDDQTEAVILFCQEDFDKLKLEGLNGKVYYAVETRKPPLEKETRNFLYKLHSFRVYNKKTITCDFYRWIAMWNTEVYYGEFKSIQEAIMSVLKLDWKVAQIGNEVNDTIEYRVLHAREGE